jgi:hypothetical protein
VGSSAEQLARATGIPIENFHPIEPGLHMEIIDTKTMQVWQTMANVTLEDDRTLTLEDPYRKAGIGALAGYCSYFRRSPDAEVSGPMQTMELGGHRWSHCAIPGGPPSFPAGPDGPRLMAVNKHHSIVYAAGTDLRYLESPTGEIYVHVIDGHQGTKDLLIPEKWFFGTIRLERETTVELPCPTSVFFFTATQGTESYQGPIGMEDLS